jgi:Tat protein secretion system quality control protein TatD with DNase activity
MLRGNLMGIEKRTETSWMCLKMESSPISGDVYENMMIVGEIGLDHKFTQGQP